MPNYVCMLLIMLLVRITVNNTFSGYNWSGPSGKLIGTLNYITWLPDAKCNNTMD